MKHRLQYILIIILPLWKQIIEIYLVQIKMAYSKFSRHEKLLLNFRSFWNLLD